jgi:hypothetical protein
MDQDTSQPRQPIAEPVRFNGFWPILLIGVSLLMIFSWEVWIGVDTRQTAQLLLEQQGKSVDKAKQVQANLEKLVRDLVELSKTDDEAKKLVTKFGIKISNPTLPTATPPP